MQNIIGTIEKNKILYHDTNNVLVFEYIKDSSLFVPTFIKKDYEDEKVRDFREVATFMDSLIDFNNLCLIDSNTEYFNAFSCVNNKLKKGYYKIVRNYLSYYQDIDKMIYEKIENMALSERFNTHMLNFNEFEKLNSEVYYDQNLKEVVKKLNFQIKQYGCR